MVDDDGGRQLGEEILKLGQIRRLEIDDNVPVVLDDAPGDLDQLFPLPSLESKASTMALLSAP
jgi:hypothetical protein